jgi:hypothetical protein
MQYWQGLQRFLAVSRTYPFSSLNISFWHFWHAGICFGYIPAKPGNKKKEMLVPVPGFQKQIKPINMKKIFTLALGVLFTTMMFAADRRPSVSLVNKGNYKIVIDGRSFFANNSNMNLSNIMGGRHTVKVYELRQGIFMKSERLVDAATFDLRRNDIKLTVGRNGQIRIQEEQSWDRGQNNQRDRDGAYGQQGGRNDRDDRNDRDHRF